MHGANAWQKNSLGLQTYEISLKTPKYQYVFFISFASLNASLKYTSNLYQKDSLFNILQDL